MAATVIDGKTLAAKCKERVKAEAGALSKRPGLAVIIVGDNPASRTYVNSKRKDCAECGIYSEEYALLAIDPDKDVDGFHPVNVGRLSTGQKCFLPCTPAGVMEMLKECGIDPKGKDCVVVGRSNIVGKPMAMLLLAAHGTVTVCHSRTRDLGEVCRRADILVAAVGKRNIITADMVKEGAVVIDVAMNRDEAGKLCGDVDYGPVAKKASYITPVPGGVGPMTRAMLMVNTLEAARLHGK